MNALALVADMHTIHGHGQQLLHIGKALARGAETGLTVEQLAHAARMNSIAQGLLGQVLARIPAANDAAFATAAG